MESSLKPNNQSFQSTNDTFEQFAESTNPFPTNFSNDPFKAKLNAGSSSSNGKRRRIYKPLYSVRLS